MMTVYIRPSSFFDAHFNILLSASACPSNLLDSTEGSTSIWTYHFFHSSYLPCPSVLLELSLESLKSTNFDASFYENFSQTFLIPSLLGQSVLRSKIFLTNNRIRHNIIKISTQLLKELLKNTIGKSYKLSILTGPREGIKYFLNT
jgi:hypothetical protein